VRFENGVEISASTNITIGNEYPITTNNMMWNHPWIIVDGVFQLRLKSVGICQQCSEVSRNCTCVYRSMPDLKFLTQ
jgi:hypothetical protein